MEGSPRELGGSAVRERRYIPLMTTSPTPARILETATAFWPAKVLLSAVELGLFTALANGPMNNAALARKVDIAWK